jgi:hypothetical protein
VAVAGLTGVIDDAIVQVNFIASVKSRIVVKGEDNDMN